MTVRLDRRRFLAAAGALASIGAAGLRPALAQSGRLRLIFWGSQARADRTYAAADLFEAANGVDVSGEFLSWPDYWTKLATQTAGGNAPDVIQMDYRYIVEYANRGAIAPLDPFLGGALDIADLDADQIEGGKVNGQLYGISLGANSVALMINTAALEEAAVAMPGRDTTYDDLVAMGEAFSAGNKRRGMRLIQDASGYEPALENWLRQRGKALYTADGALGFTPQDLTEWFELWAGLRDAGVTVAPDNQALDAGGLEQNMVTLGKAALSFANSNQLVAMQALNKDPIAISNFPRVATDAPGGHYRKPAMLFSVGGSAADKEAAARFISFFVNDPEAGKLLSVERGIPISAAVREAIEPQLNDQERMALAFVSELGDLVGPIPPAPPSNAGEIERALITKAQEVAFGMQSPAEGGESFHAAASEMLSRS